MTNTRDTLPIAWTLAERELALRRDEITATLLSGRQEARARHPMLYAPRLPGDALWTTWVLTLARTPQVMSAKRVVDHQR